MTNYQFVKGIEIISKCIPADEMDSYTVEFRRNQIYFGEPKWITDEKIKDELTELGWFLDDKFGCWSSLT